MVLLQRILYFSKEQVGVQQTFSREGVQLFPGGGGVQMLISIETHITCDFQGVFGPPIPPLDPHMVLDPRMTFRRTSHGITIACPL